MLLHSGNSYTMHCLPHTVHCGTACRYHVGQIDQEDRKRHIQLSSLLIKFEMIFAEEVNCYRIIDDCLGMEYTTKSLAGCCNGTGLTFLNESTNVWLSCSDECMSCKLID